MNSLVGAGQRRELDALGDDLAEALQHRRHRSRFVGIGPDLIKIAELSLFERRRKGRRLEDLALLKDNELLRLRRPLPGLSRRLADALPLLKALVGPDVNHRVQRPDL